MSLTGAPTEYTATPQPGPASSTAPSALQPLPSQPQLLPPPLAANGAPEDFTRPRDARMIELLLTSQGVSAYEERVPLLLMDFAYRHTSSILSDAIPLSSDPYIAQTGGRGGAAANTKESSAAAAAAAAGDNYVTAGAVRLAIASRLGYQFRGASAAGGLSKEWLLELARERNKVALPKVTPNEWAVRLPSERFVLSGLGWGLKDAWQSDLATLDDDDGDDEEDGGEYLGFKTEGFEDGQGDEEDEDMEAEERATVKGEAAMEGVDAATARNEEEAGGDGVEGGTMEDVFGQDMGDGDEEMQG